MKNELTKGLTTAEYAAAVGVKENTPRVALVQQGHYLGVKPIRLPNRRLLWPLADVQRVLNGDAK